MRKEIIKKLIQISFLIFWFPLFSQWTSLGATNKYFYGTYNGNLYTWGENYNLGKPLPMPIELITDTQKGIVVDPVKICRGYNFNIVLKSDRSIWGWGVSESGQLGVQKANVMNPTRLNYNQWNDIATGYAHALAVREDGTLWAWGKNFAGEVGIGNTTPQYTPVQVGTDNDWVKVYAGMYQSYGIKKNGTLWAWGLNKLGALGDGTVVDKYTPVQIGTDKDWLSAQFFITGTDSIFAIKGTNVYAWGRNFYMLLDATYSTKTVPTQVGSGFKSIACNLNYALGIKDDGSLWRWGLGPAAPERIGTDNDWINVVSGTAAFMILKDGAEKTLWSYGPNSAVEIPDLGYADTSGELRKVQMVDPIIRTYVPGLSSNSSMILLGKKRFDGSTPVTETGFYISKTNTKPNNTDLNYVSSIKSSYGYFIDAATVSPNTTYYVTAYAKNSSSGKDANGSVAYGNSVGNVVEVTTNNTPFISGLTGLLSYIRNADLPTSDKPLQTASITADNLKPDTNIKVIMHSKSTEFANIKVSSEGKVDSNINFPTDLEAGPHTIILSGVYNNNQPFNEEIKVNVSNDGLLIDNERVIFKNVSENNSSIFNALTVIDGDEGQTSSFSIQGKDAALFTVDAATGKLDFKQAPDYENPQDSNKDNVYEVYILATDNGSSPKVSVNLLKIRITDQKELPMVSAVEKIYLGNQTISTKGSILASAEAITEKGYLLAKGVLTANDLKEGATGVTKYQLSTPQPLDLSVFIENLSVDTDYSIRYYAKNALGTGYGEVLNFRTLSSVGGPKITYNASPYYYTINKSLTLLAQNHGSRIPTPSTTYGDVSIFAGSTEGDVNGGTPTGSKLNAVTAMAFDGDKNFYFVDQYNHKIKKITKDIDGNYATVSTLAGGLFSFSSSVDGTGANAKFNYPTGMVYDGTAAFYVTDYNTGNIRKVSLAGEVTTIVTGLSKPTNLVYNVENNVAFLYVADSGNHCIKKVNLNDNNSVSVFAGISGASGSVDGLLAAAKFNLPTGLAITKAGVVYVVDRGNNKIRKIENGTVSTFAGNGTAATTNGDGVTASFYDPYSVLLDGDENLYVTQALSGSYPSSNPGFSSSTTSTNNYIRKITPTGTVSIFAGKGTRGITNATTPTEALFSAPVNLLIDKDTNVMYVSEWLGDDVRAIQLAKGYEITPSLPAGLTFNTSSGAILGTPSSEISPVDYKVTAYNYYGSSSANVQLKNAILPMVLADVTSVYDNSAVFTSSLSFVGDQPILERGICWSKTNTSPTVSDSKQVIEPNADFQTTTVLGLAASTRYYARGYVVTNSGTFYSPWVANTEGNIIFTTQELAPSIYYLPKSNYLVGEDVVLTPFLEGNLVAAPFEISPVLPEGLTMMSNGEIVGKPTKIAPLTTYVVKTSNSSGIAYAVLNFEVTNTTLSSSDIKKDAFINLVNNPILNNEVAIYFKNSFANATIEVYDVSGKLLFNKGISSRDVSNQTFTFGFNQPSGMYFVRVVTDKFSKTIKFIKK